MPRLDIKIEGVQRVSTNAASPSFFMRTTTHGGFTHTCSSSLLSLNWQIFHRYKALHFACKKGDAGIARLILESAYQARCVAELCNIRDTDGRTAREIAQGRGETQMTTKIDSAIQEEADVKAVEDMLVTINLEAEDMYTSHGFSNASTALHWVLENGNMEFFSAEKRHLAARTVKKLVLLGANVNDQDSAGRTPLHYAAVSCLFVRLVHLFLLFFLFSHLSFCLLHDLFIIQMSIGGGGGKGGCANTACARALLRSCSNVKGGGGGGDDDDDDDDDDEEEEAVDEKEKGDDEEAAATVAEEIQLAPDEIAIDALDFMGMPAMYFAVERGDVAFSSLLLANGADIHFVLKPSNYSYLHVAAQRNFGEGCDETMGEICEWLIDEEVDHKILDDYGRTAKNICQDVGTKQSRFVSLLEKAEDDDRQTKYRVRSLLAGRNYRN